MFQALKDLLESIAPLHPTPSPAERVRALQLAAAVLLVEVGRTKATQGEAERSVMESALRQQFALSAGYGAAEAALAGHLTQVITQLEPETLGLYASIRSEFNAVVALGADPACDPLPWALPFCRREPREMDYRLWDRSAKMVPDECGIASAAGAVVVPDVLLVNPKVPASTLSEFIAYCNATGNGTEFNVVRS